MCKTQILTDRSCLYRAGDGSIREVVSGRREPSDSSLTELVADQGTSYKMYLHEQGCDPRGDEMLEAPLQDPTAIRVCCELEDCHYASEVCAVNTVNKRMNLLLPRKVSMIDSMVATASSSSKDEQNATTRWMT